MKVATQNHWQNKLHVVSCLYPAEKSPNCHLHRLKVVLGVVLALCERLCLLHQAFTLLWFTVTSALVWLPFFFLHFEDAFNMVYLSSLLDHQDWMIKLLHKRRAATSPKCWRQRPSFHSDLSTVARAAAKAVMMQCCAHAKGPPEASLNTT